MGTIGHREVLLDHMRAPFPEGHAVVYAKSYFHDPQAPKLRWPGPYDLEEKEHTMLHENECGHQHANLPKSQHEPEPVVEKPKRSKPKAPPSTIKVGHLFEKLAMK